MLVTSLITGLVILQCALLTLLIASQQSAVPREAYLNIASQQSAVPREAYLNELVRTLLPTHPLVYCSL